MGKWAVVIEPHGANPTKVQAAVGKARSAVGREQVDENTGGMIIYLQQVDAAFTKKEVSRVAYIRRATICKNPRNSFEKQLKLEVEKAQTAADAANEAQKIIDDLAASAGGMQ